MITSFTGQYRFLSNFYPASIVMDGAEWPTSEHYYQALKSLHDEDRRLIREASSPGVAKRMGRRVEVRPDWEENKTRVMYFGVLAKFTQHPQLCYKLLETGRTPLIEGNVWGDRFWGCSLVNGAWIGQNYLGRVLMLVRDVLSIKEF